MILNPPNVVSMLTACKAEQPDAMRLATLLLVTFGLQPWEQWLHTYRLYLQSIPFDLAREAWGLTQTTNTIQP